MSYTEIESVSSYISEIKHLKDSHSDSSTDIYFRGQEVDSWDIEPSIFRNDMLSIEHILMRIPLQKIPSEFKELKSKFDIMTKYQHYGMCTRLLDLTTNPLVALYFACQIHKQINYNPKDEKESDGAIYFSDKYYPSQSTDLEVKIITELANYDLSKENTINEVLIKLNHSGLIDNEIAKKWCSNEGFEEFIKIIQNNYMIIPSYTNERLKKQSGVFLLSGMFTVTPNIRIEESILTKTKGSLRKLFCDDYFVIKAENKKEILKELNLYNINEATLFPELEHQLSYIRNINSDSIQSVSDYEKYENNVEERIKANLDINNLNDYIISSFDEIFPENVKSEDLESLREIIKNEMIIDWYKRENVLSKIKMKLMDYFLKHFYNKGEITELSNIILNNINGKIKEYITNRGD